MSPVSGPHLSPAEIRKLLGVSIKALRLYERYGLLSPQRTASGWRVYGPEQVARLHQVLALKGLGLSLTRIADLLRGSSLGEILEAQERALLKERARLAGALKLVRKARDRLNDGDELSLEALVKLGRETARAPKLSDAEVEAIFEPIIDRHFSRVERSVLGQRAYDQAQVSKQWNTLIAEAKRLTKIGDPASKDAVNLARRWKVLIDRFTDGDPQMLSRAGAVWKDALADPAVAPRLPLNAKIFAFIGRAMAAAGL